jgi:hypothetical protein
MAKLAQITIGDKLFIEVDNNPTLGYPAPVGSFATWDNGSGVGTCYFKNGPLDTDWNFFDVGIVIADYLRKDGTIAVEGSLLPKSATIVDLGAALNAYRDLYAQGIKISSAQASAASMILNTLGLASDLDMMLKTNDAAINVNSKQVTIRTGAVSGTGVRANVLIDAAALDMNSVRIINCADPVNSQDVATKNYVQLIAMGLKPKQAVRAASLGANINLASALINGAIVDGVTLVTGDRVLVKSQTLPQENGIYIVAASGAASRSEDMNSISPIDEFNGAWVPVQEGTQAGKVFVEYGTVVTVGTSAVNFTWFDPLKGNDFWINASSSAALNDAASARYFGTKTGDFDIYFYRNNVSMIQLSSTQMLVGADFKFNTGLAQQILNTNDLTIDVTNTKQLIFNALKILAKANVHQKLFTNATDGDMMNLGEQAVATPLIADGDATKVLTYTSLFPNKVRLIEMVLTIRGSSGMACVFKKQIAISNAETLILTQDQLTAKSSGSSAVRCSVTSYVAGVLTVTLSGMGAFTGKNFKVYFHEIAES